MQHSELLVKSTPQKPGLFVPRFPYNPVVDEGRRTQGAANTREITVQWKTVDLSPPWLGCALDNKAKCRPTAEPSIYGTHFSLRYTTPFVRARVLRAHGNRIVWPSLATDPDRDTVALTMPQSAHTSGCQLGSARLQFYLFSLHS